MNDVNRLLDVAAKLTELALDITSGRITDALTVARRLFALSTDAIPVEDLKDYLTDRDRMFADLAADVAESIKVEGDDP